MGLGILLPILLILSVWLYTYDCYKVIPLLGSRKLGVLSRRTLHAAVNNDDDKNNVLDETTREKIDSIIGSNKVVLFMKGTKFSPQW